MSTSLSPRSAPVHPTRQQLDELDALLQRMLDLPVNQVDEPAAPEEAEPPARETRPPVSYTVPISEAPPPPRLEPRVIPAEEPPKSAPVPPAAVAPPATPAAPPPSFPSATPAAPARVQEPGPDDWVRLASTWQPSAQTWQPLAQSWQQAARPTGRPAAPQPAAPEPVREPATLAPVIRPPATISFAPELPPPPEQAESPAEDLLKDLLAAREEPSEQPTPPPAPEAASAAPGTDWWMWPFVPVNAVFDLATLPLGPLGAGLRSRAGRNLLAAAGIGSLAAAIALAAADWFGWIW